MKSNTALKFILMLALGLYPLIPKQAFAQPAKAKQTAKKPAIRPAVRATSQDESSSQTLNSGNSTNALNADAAAAATTQQQPSKGNNILPLVFIGGALVLGGVFLASSMSGSRGTSNKPSNSNSPAPSTFNDGTSTLTQFVPPKPVGTVAATAPVAATPALATTVPAAANSNIEAVPQNLEETPILQGNYSLDNSTTKPTTPAATETQAATITTNQALAPPAEVKPATPAVAANDNPTILTNQGAAPYVPPADIPEKAPGAGTSYSCINAPAMLSLADPKILDAVDALGGMNKIIGTWGQGGVELVIRKGPGGSLMADWIDHEDSRNTVLDRPLTACVGKGENELIMKIPQPDGSTREVMARAKANVAPGTEMELDDLNDFWPFPVTAQRKGDVDAARAVANVPGGVQ